jgi:segregation and condensation protein B
LETLAIVAYKQPITRVEVEKIRGVSSNHAIDRLIEYDFIQELGRLDAPGRPILFGTTEQFLRSFGLENLSQMPELDLDKMEEFKEQAEQEIGLPVGV